MIVAASTRSTPARFECDAFYSTQEIAKSLSVSVKAVNSAIREKLLKAKQVGPKLICKGEWVVAWLESMEGSK